MVAPIPRPALLAATSWWYSAAIQSVIRGAPVQPTFTAGGCSGGVGPSSVLSRSNSILTRASAADASSTESCWPLASSPRSFLPSSCSARCVRAGVAVARPLRTSMEGEQTADISGIRSMLGLIPPALLQLLSVIKLLCRVYQGGIASGPCTQTLDADGRGIMVARWRDRGVHPVIRQAGRQKKPVSQ